LCGLLALGVVFAIVIFAGFSKGVLLVHAFHFWGFSGIILCVRTVCFPFFGVFYFCLGAVNMVKRIACKVVSSVVNGHCHQRNSNRQPPMSPGDSSGPLGSVNAESEEGCFPMGIFVDVVIGD
jgi:hypothetical protein